MISTLARRGTLVAFAVAGPVVWLACASDNVAAPRPASDPRDGAGIVEEAEDSAVPAEAGNKRDGGDAGSAEAGATCGNSAFCNSGPAPLPSPATVVDADGYITAFATAVCARVQQCCAMGDTATFWSKGYGFKTPPTAATCVETVKGNYKHFAAWQPSVTAGHMSFDAARASSCVDAVNTAACGFPVVDAIFDGRCTGNRGSEVFKKLVPLDGACSIVKDGTLIGDCNPATGYCLPADGGTDGTCSPWAQPGEKCTIFGTKRYCAPQLNCENMSVTNPGTCSGEPITRKLGEKCDSISGPTELCGPGLYCDFFSSGTCRTEQADGTSCTADDQCQSKHPFTCIATGKK